MTEGKSDDEKALRALSIIILIGLIGVIVYAVQASSIAQFALIVGVGVMVAGASLLIGGLLGFLFGIPRTLQQERPVEPLSTSEQGEHPEREPQRVAYRVNTNLEQISDWLTKILVGVGLTQLTAIPGGLRLVGDYIAGGMGNPDSGRIFALGALIYFTICGFLYGYLWTRLFLAGALRRADLTALGMLSSRVAEVAKRAEQTDRKTEDLKKQVDIDADALSLTYSLLDLQFDSTKITQEELDAAIKAASSPIRFQIFNRAYEVRHANWREEKGKPQMERTIPIFRALIASDPGFHRYHAQLGYALKDKREPAWAEAEEKLTRAIELRGRWEDQGFLYYELNRAICRIMQDRDFVQAHQSSPKVRNEILADIEVAVAGMGADWIRDLHIPEVDKWMALNGMTLDDLI